MSPQLQIFFLSVGLAMDAFSVSIILGAESKSHRTKNMILVASTFATFQIAMSAMGVMLSNTFLNSFEQFTGRIAFVLLLFIAIKMLIESRKDAHEKTFNRISMLVLLTLGVATSIDALVAGTTLMLIEFPLILTLVFIGVVTFGLSGLGFSFGNRIGKRISGNMEIIGALFLILLGISFLFN